MVNKITLSWVGGEHDFLLTIGGLRAVQDACNAGPMQIYGGLRAGTWRVDWPLAVLRHGLIGAGMDDAAARSLMDALTDAHPLGQFVPPALLVIAAAIVGPADDPVGESDGAADPVTEPPTMLADGNSANSTEMGPRPDSPQERSMK